MIFPDSISNRTILPYQHTVSQNNVPHRTPCHTLPYHTHTVPTPPARGSTIRGLSEYRYHHTAVPTYQVYHKCTRACLQGDKAGASTILLCTNTTSTQELGSSCEYRVQMPSYCCTNTRSIQEHASGRRAMAARQVHKSLPSGRQSRSEYRCHTVVPTPQVHKSMRAPDERWQSVVSSLTAEPCENTTTRACPAQSTRARPSIDTILFVVPSPHERV